MSLEVSIQNVSVNFGGVKAVRAVSLDVQPGTITGLIGPNGAGKTTLFNLTTQVLKPTSGRVVIGGVDTTLLSMAECSALGVARTFQTARGFPTLDVRGNVEVMYPDPRDGLFGALFRRRSLRSVTLAEQVLDRVGLLSLGKCAYGQLSGGEQRMLEIARQIASDPKLLLLDEPTAGLDINHQRLLRDLLLSLRDQGMTIFLVEHNLGFLMQTVERVHVMALGELIASGTPEEISADAQVISAYLGRDTDEAQGA